MIIFHRVLIGTAILFAAGFAIWASVAFRATGDIVLLVLAILSVVVAGLGGYYLKHLRRFLHR